MRANKDYHILDCDMDFLETLSNWSVYKIKRIVWRSFRNRFTSWRGNICGKVYRGFNDNEKTSI